MALNSYMGIPRGKSPSILLLMMHVQTVVVVLVSVPMMCSNREKKVLEL